MTDPTDDNTPSETSEPGGTESPRTDSQPEPEVTAETGGRTDIPSAADRETVSPEEKVRELKQKAADAFRAGSAEAREVFDKSFPTAKEDFAKGVNDLSYAVGYAVSFGTALARELTPDDVSEGFERGSRAGARAAEDVIEQRRAKTGDSPDEGDETSPAA